MHDELDTRQVAQRLGISRMTVCRMARRGHLPGARLHMGSRKLGWRVPAASVHLWEHGAYALRDGSLQPALVPAAARGAGNE